MSAAKKQSALSEKPVTEYAFFQKLIAYPFVEAVYLYGSRARGTQRDNSDFDLAVMCPTATDEQWKEIHAVVRSNDESVVRCDLLRLDQLADKIFLKYIINERQVLYVNNYGGDEYKLRQEIDFFKKWQRQLAACLARIEKILAESKDEDEMQVSKALVAFHEAFDAMWVIVRKCLSLHGMRTNTPLTSFREAYMEGWLPQRAVWEAMLEDYRDTRGGPEMPVKLKAFHRLPAYIHAMREGSRHLHNAILPYDHA